MKKSLFSSTQVESSKIYLPPTWQQHADVVLHLSKLSQNVLLIIAPQEGGKTTFLQQVLTAKTANLHKASLSAKAHTSVEALLNQVVLSFGLDWSGISQATAQIQELQQESDTQNLGILTLFIDDAHLLSNEQLQALAQLVNTQAPFSQQLRLVLLGEPSLELRMFSPDFTAILNGKIYTIELEAWTLQDIQAYFSSTCAEFNFSKDQIAAIFERSRGLPGRVTREKLAALNTHSIGKNMTKKPFKLWGFHPITLGALAGLAIGGAYLVINNATTDEVATIAPVNAAQTAEQNWPVQNASPQKSSPAVAFHFDKVDTSDVIEDDMKQEFEEHSKTLSTPSASPMPHKQTIAQASTPTPAIAPIVSAELKVESKQINKEEPIAKPDNEQQVLKQKANKSLTKEENYLLSTDKRHYTLQLIGGSKEASLKQFVKKHALEGKTYSFHTKRQGKDWYIVVYGNYATAEEAKAAAKGVTENLKSSNIQPWVRDMGAVHKDIQQAKG